MTLTFRQIFCALWLLALLGGEPAFALWGSGELDRTKAELESTKTQSQKLASEVQKLSEENDALKKEVSDLRKAKEGLEAGIVPLKLKMFLIGAGALMATLIGSAAFAMLRTRSSDPPEPTNAGHALNQCPRCGWRIAEGESACSNPECRTRIS